VRADRSKIKGKLENKGMECIFVGYAENHTGDVYRLLNLKTDKIVLSRDVVWLNKTFEEYMKIDGVKVRDPVIIDDDIIQVDEEVRQGQVQD